MKKFAKLGVVFASVAVLGGVFVPASVPVLGATIVRAEEAVVKDARINITNIHDHEDGEGWTNIGNSVIEVHPGETVVVTTPVIPGYEYKGELYSHTYTYDGLVSGEYGGSVVSYFNHYRKVEEVTPPTTDPVTPPTDGGATAPTEPVTPPTTEPVAPPTEPEKPKGKYQYVYGVWDEVEKLEQSIKFSDNPLSLDDFISKYVPYGAELIEANMTAINDHLYDVVIKYNTNTKPTQPTEPEKPVEPVEPVTPPTEPTTPPVVEPEKPVGKKVSLGVAFDDIKFRVNLQSVVLYPGDTYSFDFADLDDSLKYFYGMSIGDFEVRGGKASFSYDDVADGEFYVLDFAKKPTTTPNQPTTPPTEPEKPVEPVKPTEPSKPADKPTEPVAPPKEDKPTVPTTPPSDNGKEAPVEEPTKPVEKPNTGKVDKPVVKPSVSEKPAQTVKPAVETQSTTASTPTAKTLPNTGEASSILSLVGAGLMGLAGLAKHRRD